mgnify:CR=1 FL=1
MVETSWDPLASGKNADTEIINAAQKREIKNILKSYVGMYDSFSELIQNAMDAVDKRASTLGEKKYQRRLWLTINLNDNSFSITDNGIGFNLNTFTLSQISCAERRTNLETDDNRIRSGSEQNI